MFQSAIAESPATRPTHAEVNLSRLTENFRAIQQQVYPAKVMVILKANAYGHGLIPVAQHLQSLGVAYMGVAVLEEGILLRNAGITTPILILGGILGNQIPLFLRYQLTLTASSVEKLYQIDQTAQELGVPAQVHLKIDTGMGRIGVQYYNAHTLLDAALKCRHCQVEGVYSHFANADSPNLDSAREQLARFLQALTFYEERGLLMPLRHIANSGGILQLPESYLEMVRAGILLYGVYPSAEVAQTIPVCPILSWKSQVVYFKVIQAQQAVSYGSTWRAEQPTRIVTVPVGYGDGYFRSLSDKAHVIIRGKKYPVVGKVCMDQLMVNIGQDSAYNGDEVILLGKSGDQKISCDELAENAGTIPYEILTNINNRVPRLYTYGS